MLIITGVGLCIFVFATGYMHERPWLLSLLRLHGSVHVFDAGVVMGSNFVMMFVGWEGVGSALIC